MRHSLPVMLTLDTPLAFSGYDDPLGMRSALPHTYTNDENIAYDDDGHDTPLPETLQIALDVMFTEEDSIADCCSATPAVDAPTTVLLRTVIALPVSVTAPMLIPVPLE